MHPVSDESVEIAIAVDITEGYRGASQVTQRLAAVGEKEIVSALRVFAVDETIAIVVGLVVGRGAWSGTNVGPTSAGVYTSTSVGPRRASGRRDDATGGDFASAVVAISSGSVAVDDPAHIADHLYDLQNVVIKKA